MGLSEILGIPFHIVREKRNLYGNLLVIEMVMSTLVILIVQILAPLSSLFNSSLPDLLRVFSCFILIEGLGVVPKVFAEKQLQIKRTVICEILNGVVMAGVSIILALLGYEIWSLIIGHITGQIVFTVLIWVIFRNEIGINLEFKNTGYLIKKSAFLFLVWAFTITWEYVDNGIIGAILSEKEVGFYFMAYFVAFMVPSQIIYPSIYRVVYPAMVQLKGNKELLVKAHLYSTIALMCLEVPLCAFLFFNADIVINLLFGEKWISIIPLVTILSLSPIIDPISKMGIELLKVLHHDKIILLSSGLSLLVLVGLGIAFTQLFGTIGMAYSKLFVLGSIPSIVKVLSIYQKKEIGSLFWNMTKIYAISFFCFGLFRFLGGTKPILQLSTALLSCLIISILYYKMFGNLFSSFIRSALTGFSLRGELFNR
ncbi:MAG: oligosaccharide flippase family protein [Deltaproteobacteria bacterium]|nr:oligosaccharide flippase family protein [Deltaproteobacteria bacterium]